MNLHALPQLRDPEFHKFKKLIYDMAGIDLAPTKKMLVSGRLGKRLRYYKLSSYSEYYKFITDGSNPKELQVAVDLLTTNETYFYREPDHFNYLKNHILPTWKNKPKSYRAWSAACSSGEEAYTLAMIFMEILGEHSRWEIVGTDISTRMLDIARRGHYYMDTAKILPPEYLNKFCLKGVRSQEGTFLLDKKLRKRTSFKHANLNTNLSNLATFDIVFLRNVLIYFNTETKQQVVKRILGQLHSGGYCFIGHAESLMGIKDKSILDCVELVAPTIYRKL